MKIYLEKAIFINRAPFEKLQLDFNENEIAVLMATNGSGKTTILSHIVDAWYEMARPYFPNEFENKQNKFYRVSSSLYSLSQAEISYVYLRFRSSEDVIDYVDIRTKCTEEQYNKAINIDGKIPYSKFQQELNDTNNAKATSTNFNKQKAEEIFSNNVVTYFPSYRFEIPGYLNEPYKVNLDFKKLSGFSDFLTNPIEVITGLPQLANWIMDIALDMTLNKSDVDLNLFKNLNLIVTQTLISKKSGQYRFGIGSRNMGSTRIQIVDWKKDELMYPSIFNLSSGESSILCLFGELLRQADNYSKNISLDNITGIVLIDEIDKHLHIKLQKEVLPKLFKLFPNIQFILSSHSPFLSMGLAEELINRSKIVDLDNMGISTDPTSNDLYKEVYDMMVGENNRFKEMFLSLKQVIESGTMPLIITEGKTDVQHIKKAREILGIQYCDVEFYEITGDWGDSKLKLLLEQLSKIKQNRKIIGIFDRDNSSIVSDIEKGGQTFKDFSNNVYAFCIPVPIGREVFTNISIEFYYSDLEIKKEKDGKSLYFDNEVDYLHNKSTNKPEVRKLGTPRTERENSKKIFDEQKICEVANWIHSKANFAKLIETDADFISDFNFSQFNLIFDRIKEITAIPSA